jgi:carboxymethylenebutenolidase
MPDDPTQALTPSQQTLAEVWDHHLASEFETKSATEALSTMVPDAYVNHIPVLTGGSGHDAVGHFYATHFIPKVPPDVEIVPVSRTIGADQLVEEVILRFTHTVTMDWMLPGIPPTGKSVEVPLVAIIRFRDDKIAHEHIYWDQASVLTQLGLIDSAVLPTVGAETARKVLDPSLPSNVLIQRADSSG